GVRLGGLSRQAPGAPTVGRRVVQAELAGVPFADPDPADRVRPDPARALIRGGRLDDRGLSGFGIDPCDMTAGQGGVVDRPVRCGRDPVGPGPARCVEDPYRAALWIKTPVDAALAGEPEHAVRIEGCGVEVD